MSSVGGESSRTLLEKARAAFAEGAWVAAYEALTDADARAPLGGADLDRLAVAAELAGHPEVFEKGLERAYQAWLDEGAPLRAARAAFWLGFRRRMRGDHGHATAWLARAQRLVEEHPAECAERGLLLLSLAYQQQRAGQLQATHDLAVEAAAIGERTGDRDVAVFARNVQGRALMRLGHLERGLAILDETMLAMTAGQISPLLTGLIYCGVISSCQRVYAIERAREWTAALSAWCERQPGPVSFHGACRVHRAELLQVGGAWAEALEEARLACQTFREADPAALADAHYQEGEVHRLRGAFDDAEASYRAVSQHGGDPQPGLALLRLAQGRGDVAASAVRRAVAEAADPLALARLLPAAVEVHLATGDVAAARQAAEQLEGIAATFGTDVLAALSAHARGRVHLAEGDAQAALGPLRRAFWVWQKVQAPYLAARARVDLSRACAALGDGEGARLEAEAARAVFVELEAATELAALGTSPGGGSAGPSHRLTQRELQVLRLVAAGKTNKAIGRELFVSEKTVDRHVSNIFGKIDVSSRAAATAWAYQHGLV